jgi:hypothetical protein
MLQLSGGVKFALAVVLTVVAATVAYFYAADPGPPTVEQYVGAGKGRSVAPPDYRIGGLTPSCRNVRIVLSSDLDDFAAAYPGFVIINPKYWDKLPRTIQLYVFGHECGHQLHGPSEEEADCYSIFRGDAQGWLDQVGVNAICDFWKPYAGDNKHLPGPERCALMRRCFSRALAQKG